MGLPEIKELGIEIVSFLSRKGDSTQDEILEHICISRRRLQNAFLVLEQKGIIKREFRGMRTLYCLIKNEKGGEE